MNSRGVWCSLCHKPAGNTRFVCRMEYEHSMGDHGETVTEAAGVFCSDKCLIEWLGHPGVAGVTVDNQEVMR